MSLQLKVVDDTDTPTVNVYIAMKNPMTDFMYTWNKNKTKLDRKNRTEIAQAVMEKLGENNVAVHDTYSGLTNVIIIPDNFLASAPECIMYYLNTFIVDIVTRRGFDSCAVITFSELMHGGHNGTTNWEDFVPPLDAEYIYYSHDATAKAISSIRFASVPQQKGIFAFQKQHTPKFGNITVNSNATKNKKKKTVSSKRAPSLKNASKTKGSSMKKKGSSMKKKGSSMKKKGSSKKKKGSSNKMSKVGN